MSNIQYNISDISIVLLHYLVSDCVAHLLYSLWYSEFLFANSWLAAFHCDLYHHQEV